MKRLVNACPHLDVIKRSVCIEGAWMAFARVKVQWAKMNAVKLATEGPPAGKEHRTPKRYFEDVLKGSRIVEGQCHIPNSGLTYASFHVSIMFKFK